MNSLLIFLIFWTMEGSHTSPTLPVCALSGAVTSLADFNITLTGMAGGSCAWPGLPSKRLSLSLLNFCHATKK